MRELERRAAVSPSPKPDRSGGSTLDGPRLERLCLVGRGRLGAPLAAALASSGLAVYGPFGRDEDRRLHEAASRADAVLLSVPDAEIATVAAALRGTTPFLGHTSGATPVSALAPAGELAGGAFGLHPLQTFAGSELEAQARFRGASAAIAGSTPSARRVAESLASRLGMTAFEIEDSRRPAYHAAAAVASNFVVTLQDVAEELAAGAGLTPERARAALTPLVRATVENWAALGPDRALTGPIVRGDDETVERQRGAVAAIDPALVPLFDALVDRTRAIADRGRRARLAVAAGAGS